LDGCVQCSLDVLQNNILWCDQAKWVVCGVTENELLILT
jgi:hypothetical protein